MGVTWGANPTLNRQIRKPDMLKTTIASLAGEIRCSSPKGLAGRASAGNARSLAVLLQTRRHGYQAGGVQVAGLKKGFAVMI